MNIEKYFPHYKKENDKYLPSVCLSTRGKPSPGVTGRQLHRVGPLDRSSLSTPRPCTEVPPALGRWTTLQSTSASPSNFFPHSAKMLLCRVLHHCWVIFYHVLGFWLRNLAINWAWGNLGDSSSLSWWGWWPYVELFGYLGTMWYFTQRKNLSHLQVIHVCTRWIHTWSVLKRLEDTEFITWVFFGWSIQLGLFLLIKDAG